METAGTELLEDLDVGAVIITQGDEGMTIFERGSRDDSGDGRAIALGDERTVVRVGL